MALRAFDLLQSTLFAEKYVSDDRVPIVVLEIPWWLSGGTKNSIGFSGWDSNFWNAMFALVLSQSIINVIVAVVVYKLIIQKRGSWTAYLTGYGILLPALLAVPPLTVQFLDLQNTGLILCSAASPVTLIWRCLEAMYDSEPPYARGNGGSLSNLVCYYTATMQFVFDPKTAQPIRCTWRELAEKTASFTWIFVQTTLVMGFLRAFDYQVFPTKTTTDHQLPMKILEYLSMGHLANNYLMACLTGLCLETGSTAMGIVTSLATGYSTIRFHDNPLSASTSPADFWGRRWNLHVSSSLKRAIFVPCRKAGYSRAFSAVATFLASGAMHEYLLMLFVFRRVESVRDIPSVIAIGTHMYFFAWCGMLLLLQDLLSMTGPIQWINHNVPRPGKTALVLFTTLPVSHWFTQTYVEVGFYDQFGMGFPRIFWLVSD